MASEHSTSGQPVFQGSLVALVTPMHPDGALDRDAYRALIDWHVTEGTDALVVVGTTGESPTVSMDEHAELIKIAVEHAAGRGHHDLHAAADLAQLVGNVGAAVHGHHTGAVNVLGVDLQIFCDLQAQLARGA